MRHAGRDSDVRVTRSVSRECILALEGAVRREFSLAEMALPCGILLAVGITCLAAGAVVLSRQEG